MNKPDRTTFFPIPNAKQGRRLSLGKQLSILMLVVLLLFISVGFVLQTRLEQTQLVLNDLTLTTIPAMNSSTRGVLKSSELLLALESLTSARSPAERRIAELEVQKKIDESTKDIGYKNQTEILLLKSIREETISLNQLIDQKLDLANQINIDLSSLWDLKKHAEYIKIKQDKSEEKDRNQLIQWKVAFLEVISLAYHITTTERLGDLQEIHRNLERHLNVLDSVETNLSEKNKVTIQSINANLRDILSDPENLTELRANYLRVMGRARGREHFIRNMISDYSNITNQLSLNEHKNLQVKAAELDQGMHNQKTWFISGFLLLAGMVIATLAFYSNAIKRLKKLTRKIHRMTEDSNDNTLYMDEIDELFQAFDGFSQTIDMQKQRLEALSLTDSLTNIANRRAFDLHLFEQLAIQKNGPYDLSVLLIDVDFFKQYNDYYGHISGDEALQKIAAILDSTIDKKTDLIARYGGEEFVVILSGKNAADAKQVAQKMQQALNLANIEHADSQAFSVVTISIGIVTIHQGETTDTDTLMKKADTALYHSKHHGRNRATHFNDIT
ncbi:diguanylate cyclase [Marinomonas rhizomae]|uniref:GGDEF domain-containing protein n=1 Tax=Marinomonas rhizomae TaxID=491948 RepID=UPI0021078B1C|nr:GGDEF domain-containing protein [Marinomonas rhizomae]UTV98990.1 diguanylate cyclase [Marinomonas rhizomae]